MSSFVLAHVSPQNLQNWIKTNAVGSLKNSAMESWRTYLATNSGTGGTLYDQETAFLRAAGFASGTLGDRWNAYLSASTGKTVHEKVQSKFQ